jgi:putative FmdB family regulatory protein
MPIYEYACPACGASFEAYLRSWGEAVACPACGRDGPEKRVSSFAFQASSSRQGGSCGCGRGGCGCRG